MMKLSDYVFDFVKKQGVRHVFMLSGGGAMHLVDSLGRTKGLEYVCCLHEQAVAIAAEAYSQYTNDLGVALVTTGPGGTNAITGVAAAYLDSIPLLVISGQVKRSDFAEDRGVRQMGNQEAQIIAMVKPITKYSVRVDDPLAIRYHLEKAVFLAKSGRKGPVWLDIPLDVQAAIINEKSLKGFAPEPTQKDGGELSSKVSETISCLNNSNRPAILVGNGVRLSGAEKELLELIRKLGIPVLTTWKAIDLLPESHQLYFGRPGAIASRGANFIQQTADFLLILGARLDLPQTANSHERFARLAKKVMVDIDANEINKMGFQKLGIRADSGDFIREFLAQAAKVKKKDLSRWLFACKKWKERYPIVTKEHLGQKKFVSTYALILALSRNLSENDLFVPSSSGASSEISQQAFIVKDGQRVFASPGLGAMGFGIPEAIGGAIASKKRTIAVDGDGGFQLNIQELETVKRLKLPIKFFVLCNDSYGSIRNTQNNYFAGHLVGSDRSSGVTVPDTVKVAKAYGIPATWIRTNSELEKKVKWALKQKGPAICAVLADPNEQTSPRTKSRVMPDGSMRTTDMVDLAPFLEKEELEGALSLALEGIELERFMKDIWR